MISKSTAQSDSPLAERIIVVGVPSEEIETLLIQSKVSKSLVANLKIKLLEEYKSNDSNENSEDNYLKNRYLHFKRNYGQLIKDLTNNEMLESIVYAVIIYEDFNRPKIAQRSSPKT
jgi:hypothetical protein